MEYQREKRACLFGAKGARLCAAGTIATMQRTHALVLFSVLLCVGSATALTCAEKGFKETKVLCSSCKNLEQFVNDAGTQHMVAAHI